jgi:hypothetical protein
MCCAAIDQESEDIDDMMDMIRENHEIEIETIF